MTIFPLQRDIDVGSGSFTRLVDDLLTNQEHWSNTWHVAGSKSKFRTWIRMCHRDAITPDQGWKLHVSAEPDSACEVLHRALSVLLDNDANFKLAGSPGTLAELNSGAAGQSQIGKFITVYPNTDDQAVHLAIALDEATRGLRGPHIPSDRALSSESLVHYRYGGFGDRRVRVLTGQILPAIFGPDGTLVPDDRTTSYQCPPWAVDPFEIAGIVQEPEPASLIVADRYLLLATLYRSAKGALYLGMDLDSPRKCVLKRARRDAGHKLGGRNAIDCLRREANFLGRLAGDPRFPAVYDVVEHNGDLYLVMEDIEGQTIEERLKSLLPTVGVMDEHECLSWGIEIADALAAVHGHGLLHRDLKSRNVIIAPDGQIRIFDFDSAIAREEGNPSSAGGTFGYMSPQQEEGAAPSVQDDIYGFGALLYLVATGVEPSNAPNRQALMTRPIEILNPTLGHELIAIISRCLDPNPEARFASAVEVRDALVAARCSRGAPGAGRNPKQAAPVTGTASTWRGQARRLADTLRSVSRTTPDGMGRYWLSTHTEREGVRTPDLNTGSAGTILSLAELVDEFGDEACRAVLSAGAHTLIEAPRPEGPTLAGLYVGEAGIGAALLRAGQVLGDDSLIDAAEHQGRMVAGMPWGSPDLFNGTAGRLRFHLWLWDETGADDHLQAALAAGQQLLASVLLVDDSARWQFGEGFESMHGQTQLGYAHGAAGIADALLDLFAATDDTRFFRTAVSSARWIARHMLETLPDARGANWPVTPDGSRAFVYWCHGAAGIGRFFLHLAATEGFSPAHELAHRAATMVAEGARWAGPTQCHGLAGNLEFLLDVYQATNDPAWLDRANELGILLSLLAVERDGLLMWPSESSRVFTPDYMVGYAGVGPALLRLVNPRERPHQLSRRGFRYAGASRGRNGSA